MLSICIGFVLGLITIPLLYAIIPGFFGIPTARARALHTSRPAMPLSGRLQDEIQKCLVSTIDLAWINVILHRMYFEAIRNYNFEYRIKQNVLRSCSTAIGEGLLKNVKITGLNFGFEAPYLKSMRVLAPDEYERILKNRKSDQKMCSDQISNKISQLDPTKKATGIYSNKIINFSSILDLDLEPSENDQKSALDDGLVFIGQPNLPDVARIAILDSKEEHTLQEIYKNLTFIGELEYHGTIQMAIEVELPRNININSTISIKKLNSNFLFRMPSDDCTTRCELCLIDSPEIEIEVQSGLVTGNRKLYFQNSISNLLRRIAHSSFRRTFCYPSWFQLLLPMVSFTSVTEFIPQPVIFYELEDAWINFEKILLAISSDFKVLGTRSGIKYGRSHSKINDLDYLYFWTFKLPPRRESVQCGRSGLFDPTRAYESALLHCFETLDILKAVIPGLKQVEVVCKKKKYALVKIAMQNCEMEFLRMEYKSTVMFYRNDSRYSEFLAFRIQDGELSLFNFSSKSSDLYLSAKRVAKLKARVASGSTADTSTCDADEFSSDYDTVRKLKEIEELFKNALDTTRAPFNVFSITLAVDRGQLMSFLMEDGLRMKNFGNAVRILSSSVEGENIKAFVVEVLGSNPECIKVHTFFGKRFVVDGCFETGVVFIYRIHRSARGAVELRITHRTAVQATFPNVFIELLKIRASFQTYFSLANTQPYADSDCVVKLERHVKSGTVLLELQCDTEDDYSLELFSCKKQAIIFSIYKIITSKPFTVIYPVDNDFLRISLIPKHKSNARVEYKCINFEHKKSILVRGLVGLGSNEKLRIKMNGNPMQVIFWEKNTESEVAGYIKSSDGKDVIGDSGVVRSEEREYLLVFKNKKEKKRNIEVFAGLTEFC